MKRSMFAHALVAALVSGFAGIGDGGYPYERAPRLRDTLSPERQQEKIAEAEARRKRKYAKRSEK